MFTASKMKWLAALVLAGALLLLTLVGGDWGTTYTVKAEDVTALSITQLWPDSVPYGQIQNVLMIISGTNFGNVSNTGVRVKNQTVDNIYAPLSVTPDGTGLSVVLPYTIRLTPTVYDITVVVSTQNTMPTVPTLPAWDVESNALPFVVYQPQYTYLPQLLKN